MRVKEEAVKELWRVRTMEKGLELLRRYQEEAVALFAKTLAKEFQQGRQGECRTNTKRRLRTCKTL